MELFSQRQGIRQAKNIIQVDSMDDDLRNSLWNALDICYWVKVTTHFVNDTREVWFLCKKLWFDYFKTPLDTMPRAWVNTLKHIRNYYFDCEWFEVYDFIDFVANNYPLDSLSDRFKELCNVILEREVAGYRFIGGKIIPITAEEEITEIEEALGVTDSLKPVSIHLKTALDLFSNRESPDYRNSIKESISAVEAICRLITSNDKATLGDALKLITNKIKLHSALQQSFNKLYGYTSDEGGIRHSLLDEPTLDFEDAKYMLVSCSAFINYLKLKASKAGIVLETK